MFITAQLFRLGAVDFLEGLDVLEYRGCFLRGGHEKARKAETVRAWLGVDGGQNSKAGAGLSITFCSFGCERTAL